MGLRGCLVRRVLDMLASEGDFEVVATTRPQSTQFIPSGIHRVDLDAAGTTLDQMEKILTGCAWAINCIGLIKHKIRDGCARDVGQAVRVNALFPHQLASAAAAAGCRVIQIATDCVYSGRKGEYVETDQHDPLDVYGKTKSLGEVMLPHVHNLRCSIIGPENKEKLSLFEWFMGQHSGSRVAGFTNHYWNGLTTYHFGKICSGIIKEDLKLPTLCHVVPRDTLAKGELLALLGRSFHRVDVGIDKVPAKEPVNRTLKTLDPARNQEIWKAAGYGLPPSLEAMVEELAWYLGQRKGVQP